MNGEGIIVQELTPVFDDEFSSTKKSAWLPDEDLESWYASFTLWNQPSGDFLKSFHVVKNYLHEVHFDASLSTCGAWTDETGTWMLW